MDGDGAVAPAGCSFTPRGGTAIVGWVCGRLCGAPLLARVAVVTILGKFSLRYR